MKSGLIPSHPRKEDEDPAGASPESAARSHTRHEAEAAHSPPNCPAPSPYLRRSSRETLQDPTKKAKSPNHTATITRQPGRRPFPSSKWPSGGRPSRPVFLSLPTNAGAA